MKGQNFGLLKNTVSNSKIDITISFPTVNLWEFTWRESKVACF